MDSTEFWRWSPESIQYDSESSFQPKSTPALWILNLNKIAIWTLQGMTRNSRDPRMNPELIHNPRSKIQGHLGSLHDHSVRQSVDLSAVIMPMHMRLERLELWQKAYSHFSNFIFDSVIKIRRVFTEYENGFHTWSWFGIHFSLKYELFPEKNSWLQAK